MEAGMPAMREDDRNLRDRAYYIWEREGRPDGRAFDHWVRAVREAFPARPARDDQRLPEEEKILAGRIDVNMPAWLTRDVLGG
jgi:hypothetical protein